MPVVRGLLLAVLKLPRPPKNCIRRRKCHCGTNLEQALYRLMPLPAVPF